MLTGERMDFFIGPQHAPVNHNPPETRRSYRVRPACSSGFRILLRNTWNAMP